MSLVRPLNEEELAKQWDSVLKQAISYESRVSTEQLQYDALLKKLKDANTKHNVDKSLEADIAQCEDMLKSLLQQFEDLVGQLRACANASNKASHVYKVERYESVVRDFKHDFNRTKKSVGEALMSHHLFGGHGNKMRSRTDQLMKERSSLETSIRMTDELIGTSIETKSNLEANRDTFSSINFKVNSLSDVVPSINKLMGQISRHKQRDNIVLAFVIASCMCFTIVYSMTHH